MNKIVDARGLSCPHPVILTKKAMDNEPDANITTIVSDKVAKENVSKLATSQGYKIEVEEKDDGIYLNLIKSEQKVEHKAKDEKISFLITSEFFGRGSDELGKVLMKSFLFTLTEMDEQIESLIFMNSGVYLTCEESPVLDYLRALQDNGVEILSCGTCLDFYQLKDKLAVGKVTNMYTAIETFNSAAKSITL